MGWADEVLAEPSVVGWWPTNEGTGAPADASVNGNDATLASGTAGWTTDGVYGNVLEVLDAAWETPAVVPGDSCTLMVAAKLTYVSGVGDVRLQADDFSANNLQLRVWSADSGTTSDIDVSALNPSDTGTLGSADNPAIADWALYALTADGPDLTLYVNGVSVDTDTLSTATTADLTVVFGGNFSDPSADGGLIAGVAAFDAVLSPTRIAEHATAFLATGDPVTWTADVTTVEVSTPTALFGAATVPRTIASYGDPENAPLWVASHGEPISIDKPLNSYARATVRVTLDGSHPDQLDEVEITRNGHRHFLGRMRNIGDDSANGHLDYQCFDDWHLFTQRYAGDAQRTNYLDNGYFEDEDGTWSGAGWSEVNAVPTAESDTILSGKKATRLDWAGPDTEPAHYDSAFAKETSPYGSKFYVAAWCFIDGAFTPGYKTFGLRCRYDTGTMQGDVATFIDATHPINTWTRHYLELPVPANVLAIVVVELWSPIGSIVWDHVQCVGNTADGAPTPNGSDQALIAGEFVRAGQDEALGHADLGIARSTPVTGIRSTEMMVHFEHEQTASKVETMGTREEGFDWHLDVSGAKVFRTHFPRRGSNKGTLTFPGDVSSYTRTVTGTEAASSIITTGDANDPAREEGAAWDEAALNGLRPEAVVPLPQGAAIGLLGPKAKEYLRQRIEAPQEIDAWVTADEGDGWEPGDTCTFTADRGAASFSAEYRVVNWHADCPTDRVKLSLVRWIDPDEM